MTQTNGTERKMPTLDAMIETVKRIERETGRPATEYKMHPDDYAALRMQLKPSMYAANAPTRPPEIYGLRIVLDCSAERLPTKAPM
jgi:hypothetical protein